MKSAIKIERENVHVAGHSGHGRYVLIGAKDRVSRLTERQASEILGQQILLLCDKYLKKEHGKIWLIDQNVGIKLTVELEAYETTSK